MNGDQTKRRPGDLIIDRYMPGATPQEREAAHENLRQFASVMLSVFTRMARDDHEREIRALGKGNLE